jgi:hypothetical protein
MNIINKARWFTDGWQIRQTTEEPATAGDIQLFVHHAGAVSGDSEVWTILDHNQLSYRGQWLFIAVTIDNINKVAQTYINGVANGSPHTYSDSFLPVPADPIDDHFTIGAFSHDHGGFPVNGNMRSVRFYHGILDADDIAALYAND